MPLEDVHVMELDRATSRLEVTRINPTRQYAIVGPRGTAFYTWQNGKYYGAGGVPLDETEVPPEFVKQIDLNPPTVTMHGPAVTAVCRICGENMNSSEMENHLIGHVNATLQAAGAIDTRTTAKNTRGS